jgi:hypothetical protein
LIALVPSLALAPLVVPAAQTVRGLPAGSVLLSPLGFRVSGILWPAPIATLLLAAVLLLLWRSRTVVFSRAPEIRRPSLPRLSIRSAPRLPARWVRRSIWTAFAVVMALAVLRP